MHGDDRGARAVERKRVLEVAEIGPQSAQEPRQLPGHAPLLAARGQRERLHAVGNQLGTAAHRNEAKAVGQGRQLAQEVLHVGLVSGALAAEDVRVDQYQGAHATSW